MLKANEFDLKLAATQLQTRSVKFINAKIYALSVTNAHSIFARISYINFFASRVTAQVVKKIEIKGTGDWVKTERGKEKRSFILVGRLTKQARKGYRCYEPSGACALKFCSFVD